MDKNNIALATALVAFNTAAPAAGVDGSTTQFSIMQNAGQATILSDPRTKGEGLRLEARRGDITVGVEKFKDTLLTGPSKTWYFDKRYENKYVSFYAGGSYGAGLEHTYEIQGQRITVDKSMALVSINLGNLGTAKVNGKIGADLGYLRGEMTSDVYGHFTLAKTGMTIIPGEKYKDDAKDVLDFLEWGEAAKARVRIPLPLTFEGRETVFNKKGNTPYGGVSASVTATLPLAGISPLTQKFTAIAGIGGRMGLDKTTLNTHLGVKYDSNPGASSTVSGYTLSAALRREDTLRDTATAKMRKKAEKWADRGNEYLNQAAQHPYYQEAAQTLGYTGAIPTIQANDIMKAFGINPHLQPKTSLILQGAKTFEIGSGQNLTVFAKTAVPIKTSGAHTSTQVGVAYNF